MASTSTLLDSLGRPISAAAPGLIVFPNIDADARRLPTKVDATDPRRVKLDFEYGTKLARDDELVVVQVHLAATIDPSSAEIVLQFEGPVRRFLTLYDRRKRPLPSRGDAAFRLRTGGARVVRVYIEATSLTATPLAPARDGPTQLVLRIDGIEHARAAVTIAPLLVSSALERAERLYVCDIDVPEAARSNHPTLAELELVLSEAKGVALIKVPHALNHGDGWMQDQVQFGYCHAPERRGRVVVHLPRARSNVIQTGTLANLGQVVTTHFPSRDLGLFQDFWKLRLGEFETADGRTSELVFANSYQFALRLGSVDAAWSAIAEVFAIYSEESELDDAGLVFLIEQARSGKANFLRRLRRLPGALRKLGAFLTRVRTKVGAQQLLARQSIVDEAAVAERVGLATDHVHMGLIAGKPRLRVVRADEPAAFLDPDRLDDLLGRLASLHDSVNYGGNIEASPPLPDAPLGKLVLGSSATRPVDPRLLRFLVEQGVQPPVHLDTSWLDVAHVDEIISFVPASGGPATFAIVHASPATALALLETARTVTLEADLAGKDGAKYFLTALLRGKYWLYVSPPKGEGFEIQRPPHIHRRYHLGNYSEPARGHTRQYHAGLSVRLLFERLSMQINRKIQETYIERLVNEVLPTHFGGVELLPLPVMFDEVPVDHYTDEIHTSAFTPNVVNLQVVNGLLLVPKPYGPRMGVEGAIATLKRHLDARLHGRLTETELERSGLLTVTHWDTGGPRSGEDQRLTDLERIARQFNDGFVEGQLLLDEQRVQIKILEANRGQFDAAGNLRPGWRRLTIPERSVDLFEAFTQIQLESLSATVRFVDSWYYHVRLGELHCATQVLRRPAPPIEWWTAGKATGHDRGVAE